LSDSLERLVALVLDVAKAHRRILIRPQDRGLLCFRHKNVLYQCTTLNFGARVSSFYWARAAGLLVRLVHKLVRVRHSAKIYVDDLLCLLDSASAPVWASHIVVLCLLLKIPLSWHKCALSARVVWIGWELDVSLFMVRLDPQKFSRLCTLLRQALSSRRCSTHLLERITGKLLWLSSLFRTFRPSLAPLYSDQHAFLPTMTALDPQRWGDLRAKLSPDLRLLQSIGLAALPPGSRILRIGQTSESALVLRLWLDLAERLRMHVLLPPPPDWEASSVFLTAVNGEEDQPTVDRMLVDGEETFNISLGAVVELIGFADWNPGLV
ncbi:hypothetical protein AK812_SmicGene30234, partial [Symbiodinium microadriaticum]